jgi:diguanylate cyclase (GGDEF)-like protein
MVGSLPLARAKRERDVAVALVAVALGLSRTFAAFRVGGASRAAIAGCLMGSIPGSSRSLRLSISGAMHVRASEGESVWRRVPTPIVVVLRVVDARTGRVIIDAQSPQRVGAQLGATGDRRFVELAGHAGASGVTEVDGRRSAYRRVASGRGNANEWIVVASAKSPTGSALAGMGLVPLAMLAVGLVTIALAGISLRAGRRELEDQANTDVLTGLGNRRKLVTDLQRRIRTATAEQPAMLAWFDLNGFKNYNDNFGHPAGDALLMRLGSALAEAVAPFGGQAYRPGGDEFCVIAGATRRHALEEAASRALSETGEGFTISTAFGSVVIPQDTGDATEAMRKADNAMYAQKHSGRATAGRQSTDVLLRALAERHPELGDHFDGVTELAAQLARRLGLEGEELTQARQAAALHDIGKVAIPDAIINKPTALTDDEWAFIRRHTIIGERIISAALPSAWQRGSCVPPTRRSTAAATRTDSPASRSRLGRASSPSATRSTP